jgi:TRAP-type C4-dicarboxylate transport system substrate-binding protein
MLLAIFSIITIGCSSSTSNNAEGEEVNGEKGEKIKLKVATYVAPVSPIYKYLTVPWMDKVTELTDGKVEFDIYPGEQLGKAHDMLQLTQDKVTDIGIFPANYFPDNMPISNVIAGFPNLSTTSSQGTQAYNDLIQENKDLLEIDYLKNGVRPIMTHVSPTYEIWSTSKEIRVPEDVKGLKMRTPGGIANEAYKSMGAVPVTVSHSETYEALEKGVIEAASYSSVAVDASGTKDLLKYSMIINLGTAIHGIVINESVWQSLPKDVQKAMMDAGQEVVKSSGEKYDADTEAFNAKFAEGASIVELTEEERKAWEKKFKEFSEKWLKEHKSDGLPYEKVLDSYKENLTKYE